MDSARAALAARDGRAPTFRIGDHTWQGPVRLPIDAAVALGHGDTAWFCRSVTTNAEDAAAVADRITDRHLAAIVEAWGVRWEDFTRAAWLVVHRWDLVDAEVGRHYGVRLVDLDAREATVRIQRLPRFQGDDPDWGYDQELAALVVDAVRSLEVSVIRLLGGKAGRKAKFEPINRPGERKAAKRPEASPADRLLGIFRNLSKRG